MARAASSTPRPQPDDGATLTRPLRREDGRLDPARPAVELERQVRAYQPWPGSFVETDVGRLVVWAASVGAGEPATSPGTLVADGDGLALATADGRAAAASRSSRPGGQRDAVAEAFLRGRPGIVGSVVR